MPFLFTIYQYMIRLCYEVNFMISKTKSGYVVKSESGKPLSKPYHKREDAEKRLKQIHYFSNKK